MILIILSMAWVVGIFLGSLFHLSPFFLLTGLIPLTGLAFTRNHKKLVILLSLSIIAIFGGAVRYAANVPDNINLIQTYNGTKAEVKGIVDRDPEAGTKTTQYELSGLSVLLNGEWHEVDGKALLFIPNPIDYKYGDVLQAAGNLETPPQLDGFDYKGYLANRGVYTIVSYPQVEKLAYGKGNPVLSWIYGMRGRMSESLVRILPEPQASLAQGIILGMRGNIPQDLKDDFSASGTTPILVISGQNLSILAGILISLGIWLFGRKRYYYIWLALAIIWIYTIFVGISPPVVRAAIMVSLFLFADMFGRQRNSASALVFAAGVMIGISPSVLWDVSFQLSVLAMGGLVLISPHFQNFTRNIVSNRFGETGFRVSAANIILDSFDVTLASLIAVWPLIAYYFGIVSLVAPVSTLLAVPALTGIIITGIIAGALGILWLPLGIVSGWAAWLFLSYLILIVRVSAAIPHSFIPVTAVSPLLIWIYYPLLVVIIWLFVNRKKIETIGTQVKSGIIRGGNKLAHINKAWIAVPLLVVAALLTVTAFTIPDTELHVSFLDVGQGDAILIRQGNQEILVDGGPDAQAISRELGKQLPFWDRTIELVVSTHPDSDHLTGLVEVLKRYGVGQVICPNFPADSLIYKQWTDLLAVKNIKTTTAQSGQTINFGDGIRIDVLSPTVPAGFAAGSDDNGVVLRVNDGDVSFLLTGDMSVKGEFALIAERADLGSTVLKVGHHGSAGSTSEEFLDAVNPQAAVISVGKNNDYGHPTMEVLDRLTSKIGENNIYRTDEEGTAEFTTDGQRLWVDTKGPSSNSGTN